MSRASTGHIRRLASGRYQARFTFPDGVRRPAPTTFQTKGRQRLTGSAERRREQRYVVADEGHRDHHLRRLLGALARQPAGERPAAGRAHPRGLHRPAGPVHPAHLRKSFDPHDHYGTMWNNWDERTAKDTPTYRARATLRVATRWNPPPSKNLAVITDAMPPRYRLLVRLAAWCALRLGS